jgi:DNA-binding GntR family transcriptional regulator
MSDPSLIADSVRQHLGIIEALRNRDFDEAERLLIENWRCGMELLLIRLGEP